MPQVAKSASRFRIVVHAGAFVVPAAAIFLPSPGGEGSARIARCVTGWGDLSTRALFETRDFHPTPPLRVDPPPPGEGKRDRAAQFFGSLLPSPRCARGGGEQRLPAMTLTPYSIFKQPLHRHCERSVAIHLAAQRKEWI